MSSNRRDEDDLEGEFAAPHESPETGVLVPEPRVASTEPRIEFDDLPQASRSLRRSTLQFDVLRERAARQRRTTFGQPQVESDFAALSPREVQSQPPAYRSQFFDDEDPDADANVTGLQLDLQRGEEEFIQANGVPVVETVISHSGRSQASSISQPSTGTNPVISRPTPSRWSPGPGFPPLGLGNTQPPAAPRNPPRPDPANVSGTNPAPGNPPRPPGPRRPQQQPYRVLIGGRYVTVSQRPTATPAVRPVMWPKEDRPDMPADVRLTFQKSATGYVLAKNNKFQMPVLKHDAEGGETLEGLCLVNRQVDSIKDHLRQFDMDDVMDIVIPLALPRAEIDSQRFDLLKDYAKLTADMVAVSCYWYNTFLSHLPYIRENMSYTFTLFKNNTDESLWNLVLEDYERFDPSERGGPLVAFLILKRIRNVSETAITNLKAKLKNLKISKLPGEDVDRAVSLVRATHSALRSVSTPDRTYVPEDFPALLYKVFQTTSVPEFNDCFKRRLTQIRSEADETGLQPNWPAIDSILSLATNTYSRLKTSEEWNVPAPSKAKALVGAHTHNADALHKCWNCDGDDHQYSVQACPKPFDEKRFKANKKAFYDAKKKGKGGKGNDKGKPKHKVVDGEHKVLNRKGVYVADQKYYHKQKKEKQDKALKDIRATIETLKQEAAAAENGTTSPPTQQDQPAANTAAPATGRANYSTQFDALTERMNNLFGD